METMSFGDWPGIIFEGSREDILSFRGHLNGLKLAGDVDQPFIMKISRVVPEEYYPSMMADKVA